MEVKTIKHGQIVRMSNWDATKKHQMAKVSDMGFDKILGAYVTDEDRVYASVRTIALYGNKEYYKQEDAEWSGDILTLEPNELVRLESNNRIYKVHPMRPKFEYISDIIHFDLVE